MPPAPNATDDESVPVNVRVLLAVNVLPSAIVNVDPVAGAVRATLLIVVAEATPRVGVVNDGLVRVLFVSVSDPARVARVPVVGRVTLVVAVAVRVVANAPEVVKFPPRVIVLPVFATPVPPYCQVTTVPFHTPVAIVPTLVSEEPVTPEPRAVELRTVVPLIS